jgi:deoxycytidylate deaminase
MISELINLNKKNSIFINIAADYAIKSNSTRYRHGAVIVHRGKVISGGFNVYYTGTFGYPERQHNSIHGEISAILNTPNKGILSECILYVVRINSNGNFLSSKPCTHCENIIEKYNIRRVIYT